MNNTGNRREDNRGGGRKRRGGGGKRGGGGGGGGGGPSRGASKDKEEGRSGAQKDQQNAGGDAGAAKERKNARGRGPRARDNARNAANAGESNAQRNPQAGASHELSAKERKKQSKAAEEELLKQRREEKERIEAERIVAEKAAAVKLEAERKEAERKEAERIEAEKKEREENAAKAAELSEKRRVQRLENLEYIGEPPSKSRISETQLRKLDSSLKKCTGFIRKLRGSGITEDSHKSLIADVRSLNLSRYISEVVQAISETKLRSSDTEYAALLCTELHQRFEDFARQLSTALSAIVVDTQASAGKDLLGRRGAMRLLVELFVLAMYPDVVAVTSVLRELMKGVRDSREVAVANLSVIASFVRAVSRFLLVQPPSENEAPKADSWEDEVATPHMKNSITAALESYYKGEVSKLFVEAKDDLRKAENATLRSRQTKGSVDDATTAKQEEALGTCDRIYNSCVTIAEALGVEAPAAVIKLEDEIEMQKARAREGGSGISVIGAAANARYRENLGEYDIEELFDSEEERAFYMDFSNTGPRGSGSGSSKKSDSSPKSEGNATGESSDKSGGAQEYGKPSSDSASKGDSGKTEKAEKADKSEKSGRTSSRRKADKNPSLDNLLARLGATETKDNADRFTNQFVNVAENSRNPTKRLSKSLIAVSPQKLNVLPAYARIAACLRQTYPEVSQNVALSLEEEFRFLAGRTDVDEKNLASCIKTARYLGEYVKFRMVDFGTIFALLAICMKDFSAHRVDIACHLLETCGRFIYRTPASSLRMGNLLDTVWRLKSVKNLEARHNTLVETAFFAAKPASGVRLQKRKERPPLQEYIRRLIYSWLTPDNVRWTAQQMRRLPWTDELQHYVIKKFTKVSHMRFSTIPEIALLISFVGKYRKDVLVGVVDGLVEAIRSGMEKNDGRDSQRRVSEVALLGELYNVHVVNETLIFYILYQFITLGHEAQSENAVERSSSAISASSDGVIIPEGQSPDSNNGDALGERGLDFQARRNASHAFYQSAPDPPKDFFRIRLTCTLVEVCGPGILREQRKKLQVFWAFFERYLFCKAAQSGIDEQLPLHVDHIVDDAFAKMTRALHGKDSGRKVLVENTPRIRIRSRESDKRDKRAALAKTEEEAQAGEEWVRCTSLDKALQRVVEIESNPAEAALVTLPARSVLEDPTPEPSALPSASQAGDTSASSSVPNNDVQQNGMAGSSGLPGSTEGNAVSSRSMDMSYSSQDELDDDNSTVTDPDLSDFDMEDDENVSGVNDSDLEGVSDEDGLDSDDDLDDEDDDEDDEDDEDEEDEDECILEKKQGPKTGEEEAFERELEQFTAAAVLSARESPSRVATLNRMAIPMGLMAQKMAADRAAAAEAALNPESHPKPPSGRYERKRKSEEAPRVGFKFLVRKGGKSQIQDLAVPATSSLAVAAKESENAEIMEQMEKKRLVLESSIVVNGDDEDCLDRVVPLRTQQDARAKEQSIKEQRSADEMALLSTLFKPKPRR